MPMPPRPDISPIPRDSTPGRELLAENQQPQNQSRTASKRRGGKTSTLRTHRELLIERRKGLTVKKWALLQETGAAVPCGEKSPRTQIPIVCNRRFYRWFGGPLCSSIGAANGAVRSLVCLLQPYDRPVLQCTLAKTS